MNSFNDLIIRVKNGYMAKKDSVIVNHSKINIEILKKLKDLGYIKSYEVSTDKIKKIIVDMLYDKQQSSKFTDVKVISTPGSRYYVSYKDLKPIVSGMGYSILSTPMGILTNKEARLKKTGGELLFNIW